MDIMSIFPSFIQNIFFKKLIDIGYLFAYGTNIIIHLDLFELLMTKSSVSPFKRHTLQIPIQQHLKYV